MKAPELPFILSPSLGCPALVKMENGKFSFKALVAAKENLEDLEFALAPAKAAAERETIALVSVLGKEIPGGFNGFPKSLEETREDICHEIHVNIFGGAAKYISVNLSGFGGVTPGLYDLILLSGDKVIRVKKHTVWLYKKSDSDLKFIHFTDLHLARRNDMMEAEISSLGGNVQGFVNFNQKVRDFVKKANTMDDLDFVVIGGDLVDFVNHGVDDEVDPADNNWQVFEEIMTGGWLEWPLYKNPGIKVPIFTTTGNHDWRLHPYDPLLSPGGFNISTEALDKFDFEYHDSMDKVNAKLDKIHARLLTQGFGLPGENIYKAAGRLMLVAITQTKTRQAFAAGLAAIVVYVLQVMLTVVGINLAVNIGLSAEQSASSLGFIFYALFEALNQILIRTKWSPREFVKRVAIPIEAKVSSLHYYLLNINPFFNYAFSAGDARLVVMETGHDCLVGQYFWDDGKSKLKPVSINDNIIDGSPDSMSFFPMNEYYTYGQIAWLEQILGLIKKEHGPIIVVTHAPPMNLKTIDVMAPGVERPLRENVPADNIRFGTINHYLSQFFYLLAGKKEGGVRKSGAPKVDMVLCGHAHQKVEFRLNEENGNIRIYLGNYSGQWTPAIGSKPPSPPYVFQTAGGGPANTEFKNPPYFRIVEVKNGKIASAGHYNLNGPA